MTEQKRTITEQELLNLSGGVNSMPSQVRKALDYIGITVIPDPAPPLPTEPGTLWRAATDEVWEVDGSGTLVAANGAVSMYDAEESAPFERLETRAEGDARVLATLREGSTLDRAAIEHVERVLREAREAGR